MRRWAAVLAVCGLVAAPAGPASASKPKTVFEDGSGDAGNQDSGLPGFSEAGFDLVSGSIARDKKNLVFSVEHAAMPEGGSVGELFRFMWHFQVDGQEYRFTAKSIDIGKPDVMAGTGTERVGQVDADGHFRLEQCTETPGPGVTLINCSAIEYLEGSFDPATATMTIILPLKAVKAKPGSLINGGTTGAANSGCQICWVPHLAERSLTATSIIDSAAMSVSYKVPKK